jgi:hypothetical protein
VLIFRCGVSELNQQLYECRRELAGTPEGREATGYLLLHAPLPAARACRMALLPQRRYAHVRGMFVPRASVTSDTDTNVTLVCVWTPRAETIPGTDAVSRRSSP